MISRSGNHLVDMYEQKEKMREDAEEICPNCLGQGCDECDYKGYTINLVLWP